MESGTVPFERDIQVSDAEVSNYRKSGWVRLSGVLSAAEVQAIDTCCISAEKGESPRQGSKSPSNDSSNPFSYQTNENYRRMFRNESELRLRFPELRPLVRKLASVAKRLLDTDDIRILWDKTFTKPPAHEGTRQTVWHQDSPYVPVDRRGMLTIWIPTQQVTAESGAMRFVPGSHRLGSLGRRDLIDGEPSLEEFLTAEDLAQVGAPVTVPLSAGDITVHDGLCLHGAEPNMSDRPRRAWTCTYVPGDALWTGAPWSITEHSNFYEYDLKPYQRFDHPDLMVE